MSGSQGLPIEEKLPVLHLKRNKWETQKWVVTEIHFGQLCLFTISVTFHHSLLMLDEWWNVTEIVNRHS